MKGKGPMPARKIVREPLLTVEEVADWLNVKPRFVRRLIAERRIDFRHIGVFVRVPESAVLAFIEAGAVDAISRRNTIRRARDAS
jgi:excisionase family DNA binding protein